MQLAWYLLTAFLIKGNYMNTHKEVKYSQSKFTSVFRLNGFNDLNESEVRTALRKLRYGDGHFYIRLNDAQLNTIEFETYDEYYVSEDFCHTHAEEIYCALVTLSKNGGK